MLMLVLNARELQEAASLDEILAAVEKSFAVYEGKRFFMPHRVHVDYDSKNLLYMPCAAEGVLGTKYLTIFPENIQKGLPSLDGLMILNDHDSGKPLCVMSGKTLTALRTGAVGGTGIRHTTPENVSTLGVIGAGVQGFYQIRYAVHVRNIKHVYLYDAYVKSLDQYIQRLTQILPQGVTVNACANATELLQASEVVVTATTAASPVLPDDPALLKGKHFIGIGSYKPTMREFPDALCSLVDTVYVDTDFAKEESGDLSQPLASGALTENRIKTFGDYLLNTPDKDRVKRNTTFFKSVGMGIFDVIVADIVYQRAKKHGLGREVEM
jgi:ornithine cyclodeaminase/alanine dehydrogenase-like protein (mu-crystallin family)